MRPITSIRVIDVIGTPRPLVASQGQKLYDKIILAFSQSDEVELDFYGMDGMVTGVVNSSIGLVYMNEPEKTKRLKFVNVNDRIAFRIELAKKLGDKSYRDALEKAFEAAELV